MQDKLALIERVTKKITQLTPFDQGYVLGYVDNRLRNVSECTGIPSDTGGQPGPWDDQPKAG